MKITAVFKGLDFPAEYLPLAKSMGKSIGRFAIALVGEIVGDNRIFKRISVVRK